MTYKRKTKSALWVKAYPKQSKALHPETATLKVTECAKKAIWHEIRDLFLCVHPFCRVCSKIWPEMRLKPYHEASEVHHIRGRNGLLLFDPRHMMSVCSKAHRWIHDNPEAARKLGLLADKGDWHKID